MSQKRKRDNSDEALDSSTNAQPQLKRYKTSNLSTPTNADALALVMAAADFATAARIAATCLAGQAVWNDNCSLFWYRQAKLIVPGLSVRLVGVDYKGIVCQMGLASIAKSFVHSSEISEALVLPDTSDLKPTLKRLEDMEKRLSKLTTAVGAVEATLSSRLRVELRPPSILDPSDRESGKYDINDGQDRDALLYKLIGSTTAPFTASEHADKSDYTYSNWVVFGSYAVFSPSGTRKCHFELACSYMEDSYEYARQRSTFLIFYKLDNEVKFTLLDDSLCEYTRIDALHSKYHFQQEEWGTHKDAKVFDQSTARKILDALGVPFQPSDEASIKQEWKLFYRRLIAFASTGLAPGRHYGRFFEEPRPWKTTHINYDDDCKDIPEPVGMSHESAPKSRKEYLDSYDASIEAMLAISHSCSLEDAVKVAKSAYQRAVCVRRLVATVRLVAAALDGQDLSTMQPPFAGGVADDASGDSASPYRIFEVSSDATAKDLIAEAGLPFSTGCAFYEVVKSESVSKGKLIVVYHSGTKRWYENDDARKEIGAKIGADCKIGPVAGFRIFVQSTSPNRKIQKGTGLLYKGEIVQAKAAANAAKKSKRRGNDSDGDGGDDGDGGGDDGDRMPWTGAATMEEKAENRKSLAPLLVDLESHGKLSLLSFFGCSADLRDAVIRLCNCMWLTAIEEDLMYEELAQTLIDPQMLEFSIGFSTVFRANVNRSDSGSIPSVFGMGFEVGYIQDEGEGDNQISGTGLWNVEVAARDAAFTVTLKRVSEDANLSALGSIPTEIALLATPLFGYFNHVETTADGSRTLHCPGVAYAVKLSVSRKVLATRLREVLSEDAYNTARETHLYGRE